MGEGLKKEDSAALKGIAILMMVFHHCYRTEKKFAGYEILFTPFTAENVIHLALYMKICVCIFAFVSGYGLMYGYLRNQNPDNRISDSAFYRCRYGKQRIRGAVRHEPGLFWHRRVPV